MTSQVECKNLWKIYGERADEAAQELCKAI